MRRRVGILFIQICIAYIIAFDKINTPLHIQTYDSLTSSNIGFIIKTYFP